MICQSCGGIVGRDCFNPEECAWITQQKRDHEQYERGRMEAEERYYHEAVERAYGEHLREEWERHLREDLGFDPISLGM